MDLGIFGLIDVILIILLIVTMIVGYKKGFMKKLLSFIGIISILIFSFMYCGQFAAFLKHNDIIYPSIYDNVTENVYSYMAENGISNLSVPEILSKALNIPGFIADLIANGMGNPSTGDLVAQVADYLSMMTMKIISFFILFLGLLIVLGILKLLANILRTSLLVKIADGILGVILYIGIYLVAVSFTFFILSLVIEQEWFSSAREWLEVDMQLNSNEFRISKVIYENNIITSVFNILI